jgi:hypothetical protein
VEKLEVEIIKGEYAIIKLDQNSALPNFISTGGFFTILKSKSEISVICESAIIPKDFACIKIDGGWALMKLVGPFDFDQTGILASFLRPLAQANIGILAISSFDTDYVLVKTRNFEKAKAALASQNYVFKIG